MAKKPSTKKPAAKKASVRAMSTAPATKPVARSAPATKQVAAKTSPLAGRMLSSAKATVRQVKALAGSVLGQGETKGKREK
jgi:hypothetical protein